MHAVLNVVPAMSTGHSGAQSSAQIYRILEVGLAVALERIRSRHSEDNLKNGKGQPP